MKKAFTLIELLVVIAIIAILAAILFPVFAQAKAAAKKAADISNLNQLGKSTLLYLNDYDDTLYPHRFNCNPQGDPTLGATAVCPVYLDGNGNLKPEAYILSQDGKGGGNVDAAKRYYWVYMLQPYTKNYQVFKNPGASSTFAPGDATAAPACTGQGCTGYGYGGQNSYGHNDAWLSPAGSYGGGGSLPGSVVYTSVPRVASTVMITDSTYYGVVPDVYNQSGIADTSKMNGGEGAFADAQGAQYKYYWKNIGGANWSYSGGEAGPLKVGNEAAALALGAKLHGGKTNVQFTDGHTKSIDYKSLVGNICWWTTDLDGAHPNCG
jgi:prepilin-type N-terminal cleavage/methylation domain-containing protein/prepilin-type processing-associated H-X9-DG protein